MNTIIKGIHYTFIIFNRSFEHKQMLLGNKQKGFSLLEVLVAVVVLSIGMLSVAGLQLRALRANNANFVRAQANILAFDMSDRMRANTVGVQSGEYSLNFDGSASALNDLKVDDADLCDDGNKDCSVTELKNWDIFKWAEGLSDEKIIPLNGAGTITCGNDLITNNACTAGTPCTAGPTCSVTVSWNIHNPDILNSDDKPDLIPQSISISFRL
jgi:type IV pilus assembly protein PilV